MRGDVLVEERSLSREARSKELVEVENSSDELWVGVKG